MDCIDRQALGILKGCEEIEANQTNPSKIMVKEVKNMQPLQPLYKDEDGEFRFKKNTIVRFLLDDGPNSLNRLSKIPFPQEDRDQFFQLIGYSLSGFGEVTNINSETYACAMKEKERYDKEH